jgi:SAM-dependent methyltransferase
MLARLAASIVRLVVKPFEVEETHLTRFKAYSALENLLANGDCNRVASISGSEILCRKLGIEAPRVMSLNYPEYDARSLPFPANYFDAVVADQVMEHVAGPTEALIAEAYRVIRPGGVYVNATVSTYQLHHYPDYRRFSPQGLEAVMSSEGFKVTSLGSWGGRAGVLFLLLGLNTLRVPRLKWHPIRRIAERECFDWPIVVWAVGIKPYDSELVKET